MIVFVKGTVAETGDGRIVIEHNGLGIEVLVPQSAVSSVKIGEDCTLYTYFVLSGDQSGKTNPLLYGFPKREDRQLFERLIGVSGIGSKTALQMLSSYDTPTLAAAIAEGNTKLIASCRGIGKKTAERLVLELREKLTKEGTAAYGTAVSSTVTSSPGQERVIEAVAALGYSRDEAAEALAKLPVEQLGSDNTALLVRLVLKSMDRIQ